MLGECSGLLDWGFGVQGSKFAGAFGKRHTAFSHRHGAKLKFISELGVLCASVVNPPSQLLAHLIKVFGPPSR